MPHALNFEESHFDQSMPESPAKQFQDYQFSDELDSWNLSTDDELNVSHQTRSNYIFQAHYFQILVEVQQRWDLQCTQTLDHHLLKLHQSYWKFWMYLQIILVQG